MGIDFNTGQINALYELENWWYTSEEQVFEIAGGPGTGKTTLIKYFIERLGLKLKNVAFLAFMGKAAIQMARHGLPAQTFHSFIYEHQKEFVRDENGKIEVLSSGKPKMKSVFVLRDKPIRKVDLIILDEVSMINAHMAKDLLTFGIPIIVLGDINQLDPIFGKPYFLQNPNVILTQIMRQAEGDPIVYLANKILDGDKLQFGVYGKSSVISKADLNEFMLLNNDVVLTTTNKMRNEINTVFRENIKKIRKLDIPHIGEKIVCRKNNWDRCINNNIYMTNGMTGTIDYTDMTKFNGKSTIIDFKPDFLNKSFKNVKIDYKRLMSEISGENDYNPGLDVFEFGYGITVHMSQGSQYDNVIYLNQKSGFDNETFKKLQYTAITRAAKSITIVQ